MVVDGVVDATVAVISVLDGANVSSVVVPWQALRHAPGQFLNM